MNDVNSEQFSHSVSVSCSSYSIPVVVVSLASNTLCYGQFCVNEVPLSSTGHSITGAVRQELVPPFRVMPIDTGKLQWELCFHPDQ